jgi:DNA (cytosine-5)-methyltransferase 1
MTNASTSIPVVDLFAGAGGLGIGARQAGGDVRLSVDCDSVACETLRLNPEAHGSRVLEADVAHMMGDELREAAALQHDDPLVVVGGPPCQPFSKAAYWTDPGDEARYRRLRARGKRAAKPAPPTLVRPDGRRTLVQEFLRLVLEAEADAFVFENVRSLTHPRHRPILEGLLAAAEEGGYRTTLVQVNAADFGVPQLRKRVLVLGSRHDALPPPATTHWDPKKDDREERPWATAGPAIAGYEGKKYFEPEEVVAGRWAEHLRTVPPGWNYKAHTEWGGHPNPTFETETRFWNFLLKLHPDLPSWTINANPGPWVGPFHWTSRRLRTPELAALQTFPKGYQFAGGRRDRVRQIGNAVPVLLAQHMLQPVLRQLAGQDLRQEPIAA